VKEQLCYVSNNIIEDLYPLKYSSKAMKYTNMLDHQGNRLRKNFVLPDFHHIMRGYVKPDDEPVTANEQVSTRNCLDHIHISYSSLTPILYIMNRY
jgi:hypothetical protein